MRVIYAVSVNITLLICPANPKLTSRLMSCLVCVKMSCHVMSFSFLLSSLIPCKTQPALIVLARRPHTPFSLLSSWTKSLATGADMSDKKRKAPSAANGPALKQQKLNPKKEEKKNGEASGWLWSHLKQTRKDNEEMKFNKKRLRFISDTQKIKQGSEGVLYWMSREQRVQGKI